MIPRHEGPELDGGCFFCGLAVGLGLTLVGVCALAWLLL